MYRDCGDDSPHLPGADKKESAWKMVNYMADRQPSHSQNYAKEVHREGSVLISLLWVLEVHNYGALLISDKGISVFGEDDIHFDKEYLYAVQKF